MAWAAPFTPCCPSERACTRAAISWGPGGVPVTRIAKWSGSTWSPLGSGVDSTVYALAWDGANLYAGGSFATAGGVAANYIAKWDGSAWSALGTGMNDYVYALAWGGGNLYAGGQFTTAGGVSVNRVARWDGSAWNALAAGTNGRVNALLWDGTNLYAGGRFTTASGVSAEGVAKWNGSAWSALGNSNLYPLALAWDGVNLYAGSQKWDGSAWSTLGAGFNCDVDALVWDGANLYAGGCFTQDGTNHHLFSAVAKWDGSAWSQLGSGVNPSTTYVYALARQGGSLYLGGYFTTAGVSDSSNFARWFVQASISSSPSGQSVYCGGSASFSVTAAGTALGYQWQENAGSGFANLSNGGVYSGVTTPTLSLTGVPLGMSGYLYRCVVSTTCGSGATSSSAALTVNPNPVPAISGPSSNSCPTQTVGLSTETGMSAYQWYLDTNPIGGATSSSYTAAVSGSYAVRCTDGNGCAGTSPPYAVTITFCATTEVSSLYGPVPARLTKSPGPPTDYYLYFQKIPSATGYNIYEGEVPTYYSHGSAPGNVCNATVTDLGTGEMQAVITPSAGDHYYLVTAFGGGSQGPSGFDSGGAEIPKNQSTCAP